MNVAFGAYYNLTPGPSPEWRGEDAVLLVSL